MNTENKKGGSVISPGDLPSWRGSELWSTEYMGALGRHILRRENSTLWDYIWCIGTASYYCPDCHDHTGGFLRKIAQSRYVCPINQDHQFEIKQPQ